MKFAGALAAVVTLALGAGVGGAKPAPPEPARKPAPAAEKPSASPGLKPPASPEKPALPSLDDIGMSGD